MSGDRRERVRRRPAGAPAARRGIHRALPEPQCRRLRDVPWAGRGEVLTGDVTEPATLTPALADVDVVYYLVHALGRRDFEEIERAGAGHLAAAAREAGVGRIVYLGGPTGKSSTTRPVPVKLTSGRLRAAEDPPRLQSCVAIDESVGSGPTCKVTYADLPRSARMVVRVVGQAGPGWVSLAARRTSPRTGEAQVAVAGLRWLAAVATAVGCARLLLRSRRRRGSFVTPAYRSPAR